MLEKFDKQRALAVEDDVITGNCVCGFGFLRWSLLLPVLTVSSLADFLYFFFYPED
jgi:hypothetical protein